MVLELRGGLKNTGSKRQVFEKIGVRIFIGAKLKTASFKLSKLLIIIFVGVGCWSVFIRPNLLVDVYRTDETTIWIEVKHLPVKKLVSVTIVINF